VQHPADKLLSKQWRDLLALLARLRREVSAVAKPGPATWTAANARKALLRREPQLAALIRDGLLGAWLTGGRDAAKSIPPVLPPTPPAMHVTSSDGLPPVRLPLIERAAADLSSRAVLLPADYEVLAAEAKKQAFTIARATTLDGVEKVRAALVRDVLEGGTLREFRQRVGGAVDASMASPARLEAVYRTNLARAYSAGQRDVLDHPMVEGEAVYVMYSATHDARTRPEHLRMETLGLQGGPIYRRDDPVIRKFWPPWGWSCRCLCVPMSIEDAAARGVREAKKWLKTGAPPVTPEWVKHPPFELPPGWPAHGAIL
jgi:SPP1 gp7 family putative phage head morphogenesis protein